MADADVALMCPAGRMIGGTTDVRAVHVDAHNGICGLSRGRYGQPGSMPPPCASSSRIAGCSNGTIKEPRINEPHTRFCNLRGSSTSRSPSPHVPRSVSLQSLMALGVPLGLDVITSRRHSPAPSPRQSNSNAIVQALSTSESARKIGRPRSNRDSMRNGSLSARRCSNTSSYPQAMLHASHSMPEYSCNALSKQYTDKMSPKHTQVSAALSVDLQRAASLRRLDACARRFERVVQELVKDAQRQSLARAQLVRPQFSASRATDRRA